MNLIIGMQSSGKSCVMMMACHCSWVEKRIALRQSVKEFMQGTDFIDMMTSYYHAKGYVHDDTYVEYQSEYMSFTYDHAIRKFTQKWEAKKRWSYKRPKVSYVPAERNMIAVIDNWERIEIGYYNILDFKTDLDTARRHIRKEQDILGTGISYEYDEKSGTDAITTSDGKRLDLMNSSSGIQSLVPQYVHLDYLCRGIYETEKQELEKNFSERQFINNLLDILYERAFDENNSTSTNALQTVIHKNGKDYVFHDEKQTRQFEKEVDGFLNTDHAEIFLEEPESNLFPPTQFQLMDWIVEKVTDKKHNNFFFIATHSPYILSHLLQENLEDFRLFLSMPVGNGRYSIKTAGEEDIQQIYDNGSDAFFNFDAFAAL